MHERNDCDGLVSGPRVALLDDECLVMGGRAISIPPCTVEWPTAEARCGGRSVGERIPRAAINAREGDLTHTKIDACVAPDERTRGGSFCAKGDPGLGPFGTVRLRVECR